MDVDELTRVFNALNKLSETAMERYCKRFGYLWIFDWIDNVMEQEVLQELTESERAKYDRLRKRFHELTYGLYKQDVRFR